MKITSVNTSNAHHLQILKPVRCLHTSKELVLGYFWSLLFLLSFKSNGTEAVLRILL